MFKTTPVTVHKYGVREQNEINSMSPAVAMRDYYAKKQQSQLMEQAQREVELQTEAKRRSDVQQKMHNQKAFESQLINKANNIQSEGRLIVFKQIMTEMFTKSLLLDEDFVEEHYNALSSAVGEYIDEHGGFAMLENAHASTKAPWLSELRQLCIETARTVSQRKLANPEAKDGEGVKYINFELDETEKEEFDYEKSKLNIEELSELVKNKTMTVIQDEKARQEKETQMEKDLEEHYAKMSEEGKDVSKEQAKWKALQGSAVKEATLFSSLFQSVAKEAYEAVGLAGKKSVRENVIASTKLSIRGKDVLSKIRQLDVIKTGAYSKLHPLQLKMISIATTEKEVKHLKNEADKSIAKFEKLLAKNPKHDHAEELKSHIAWLKKDYKNALNVKASTFANIKKVAPATESLEETETFYLLTQLNESVAAMMASLSDDDDFEDEDADKTRIDIDEDDVKEDEYEDTTIKDEIALHSSDEEDFDLELSASVENTVNMDLIFAETLTKYTMMEMFHTVNLEQFDARKIQSLSRKMLNK